MSPQESTPTKAERRQAARAEAAKLREAQARREKRNRAITLGVLVVAVVALVGVFLFVLKNSNDDSAKTTDVTTPGTSTAAPSTANDNNAITVGKSGEAGSSNEGAVVVDLYLDYMCPNCGQLEQAAGPTLNALAESGDITLANHPISIMDQASERTAYSTRAAAASAYVAQEAPANWAAFNTALFANQPAERTTGLTNAKMAEIAQAAGVPAATTAKISDGTAMETFGGWVQAATDLDAQNPDVLNPENGYLSTPTILIDGKRYDGNWFDTDALKQAVFAAKNDQ